MVRLLNVGKKKGKKRLSPSARTPEAIREQHPMYQYALNEYSQAVAPGSSNDDGRMSEISGASGYDDQYGFPTAPSAVTASRSNLNEGIDRDDSMREVESTRGAKAISTSSLYMYASGFREKLATRSPFENDMPFATYEEQYGEAYTGGSIKYIYPSGYTSMRPRSCPWKISVVVCVLFTWLSVFIVGHCSDQADIDQYESEQIDDDSLAFEIRWCGSRPLYLIWAMSMIITGLSAAYCGVIGYIKCRDFVVANNRSQPPGVIEGKSDYYVRIDDGILPSQSRDSGSSSNYQTTIYQADGTPQFWGSHIYRPTQAAVAVTHR